MIYQLLESFIIGARCIPSGETINLSKPSELFNDYEKLCYGRIPPFSAIAMDRECLTLMKRAYPAFHIRSALEWFEDPKYLAAVREEMKDFLGAGPKTVVKIVYEPESANIAGWTYQQSTEGEEAK